MANIATYAFNCCFNLTTITIPKSVAKIDWCAFVTCNNLSSVIFEDTEGWVFGAEAQTPINVTDSAINAINLTGDLSAYQWFKK